jgi:hypothetical protein
MTDMRTLTLAPLTLIASAGLLALGGACLADDDSAVRTTAPAAVPALPASSPSAVPASSSSAVASGTSSDTASPAAAASSATGGLTAAPAAASTAAGGDEVRFSTEAKWDTAGYNNDEVIYTILISNLDSRVLRCNTELKGSYYENGKLLSVSDRQISTVFPGQKTQAGNWMGMDPKSGATYSVRCHPL